MSGGADLPEVGCASRRLRRRGYVLGGRPRNGGENGNDRHDHEHVDQGQACRTLPPSRRHATTDMYAGFVRGRFYAEKTWAKDSPHNTLQANPINDRLRRRKLYV
jgi:hypothetical protein